ncbi:hypothetical protein [Gemmobacter lutimaris]|uniref:hypothetical protein n=1 Tax=Gemmobacter lutimaris TaxID=2306023 RepID=UPI0011C43A9B|nr:hypothetical protein [Gemmobacter lutimaris]
MKIISGVFPDCWTSRTAILDVDGRNDGQEITFRLYLPEAIGSLGKTITISDGITSNKSFMRRGELTEIGPVKFRRVPLRITLTCPTPEPDSTLDKRQLGCLLLSAKIGDSTIEFSTITAEMKG